MFDYDKVIKKLGKFDELSEKKQRKWLRVIFCEKDFREWFYGVGDGQNNQPMTSQMVQKIMSMLSRPKALRALTAFIKDCGRDEFDHTSCALAFLVAEQAIESINRESAKASSDYKAGLIDNGSAKSYKELSNKYTALISDLTEAIKDKAEGSVKDIARKSNLPRPLVYTTYFIVPGRDYIPKHKISLYTNQLLKEIYKWAGSSGMDDIDMIRWGNLFGPYFGSEMTTSAAVAVLLEGVNRINAYKEYDHFADVRSVWNSLTVFALSELDNAPENVRRQMLELYIKRIDKIYRNGSAPRLRVNLLSIPTEFSNLADTVLRYSDRISSITKDSLKPVADFKSKHLDSVKSIALDESSSDSELSQKSSVDSDDWRKNDRHSRDRDDRRDSRRDFRKDLESIRDDDDRGSKDKDKEIDINADWPVDLSPKKRRQDDDDDDESLIKGVPDPKLRRLEKMFGDIADEDDEEKDERLPLPPVDDDDD